MAASILVALLSATVGEVSPARLEMSRFPGAYRWDSGGFVDVLLWDELGAASLVAFDDLGWVRVLTPAGTSAFTSGPSIAIREPVAARVHFEPLDGSGPVRTMVWRAEGKPPRVARRIEDHRAEEVSFAAGDTRLAGTLLVPPTVARHPALVLLHGSGPQNRNGTLPFARFLVRQGIAILTTDKRGVGASQGDWRKASFETLADDALAAVAFLRSRPDVDAKQIGLFGVSQGGWIGPLAASRSRNVALVVSVSGPGVTPAEQMLDMIEAELRLTEVPVPEVQEALGLTRLALHYGRTGTGWDEYAAALAHNRERSWLPYLQLPVDPQDGKWEQQRLFYHYDPAPALASLPCAVLALIGGKDSGVPAEKNRRRWQQSLGRSRHRGHSVVVLSGANHLMLEAGTGSMFEIPSLDHFVSDYRRTLLDWLRQRFGLRPP
jgi:dienelactone hydrolase